MMLSVRMMAPVLCSLVALTGCVTNTVQEVRQSTTGMESTDSIVVLGRRGRPQTSETELDFVSCVSKNINRGAAKLQVIAEQDFMDAMFPWFEPRTAPAHTNDLPELMSLPALASRFEELGLRYLVWVEGSTKRTSSAGTLTCSVAPTGGGCFGFLTWEKDSSYEATVWDVRTGRVAGKVSSDANGTSYMPALVVPLPFIAPVRSSACSSLADQLKSFLRDDEA